MLFHVVVLNYEIYGEDCRQHYGDYGDYSDYSKNYIYSAVLNDGNNCENHGENYDKKYAKNSW